MTLSMKEIYLRADVLQLSLMIKNYLYLDETHGKAYKLPQLVPIKYHSLLPLMKYKLLVVIF
jgi:hypothetical protein